VVGSLIIYIDNNNNNNYFDAILVFFVQVVWLLLYVVVVCVIYVAFQILLRCYTCFFCTSSMVVTVVYSMCVYNMYSLLHYYIDRLEFPGGTHAK
jgi:hypothetical protein